MWSSYLFLLCRAVLVISSQNFDSPSSALPHVPNEPLDPPPQEQAAAYFQQPESAFAPATLPQQQQQYPPDSFVEQQQQQYDPSSVHYQDPSISEQQQQQQHYLQPGASRESLPYDEQYNSNSNTDSETGRGQHVLPGYHQQEHAMYDEQNGDSASATLSREPLPYQEQQHASGATRQQQQQQQQQQQTAPPSVSNSLSRAPRAHSASDQLPYQDRQPPPYRRSNFQAQQQPPLSQDGDVNSNQYQQPPRRQQQQPGHLPESTLPRSSQQQRQQQQQPYQQQTPGSWQPQRPVSQDSRSQQTNEQYQQRSSHQQPLDSMHNQERLNNQQQLPLRRTQPHDELPVPRQPRPITPEDEILFQQRAIPSQEQHIRQQPQATLRRSQPYTQEPRSSSFAHDSVPTRQPANEQIPIRHPREQPPVRQPADEQPPVRQPADEQPPVWQPADEQPPVWQPADEQPPVWQPAEQPPVRQPVGELPTRQPAFEPPPVRQPAHELPPVRQAASELPMRQPPATLPPARQPPNELPPARQPQTAPMQPHTGPRQPDHHHHQQQQQQQHPPRRPVSFVREHPASNNQQHRQQQQQPTFSQERQPGSQPLRAPASSHDSLPPNVQQPPLQGFHPPVRDSLSHASQAVQQQPPLQDTHSSSHETAQFNSPQHLSSIDDSAAPYQQEQGYEQYEQPPNLQEQQQRSQPYATTGQGEPYRYDEPLSTPSTPSSPPSSSSSLDDLRVLSSVFADEEGEKAADPSNAPVFSLSAMSSFISSLTHDDSSTTDTPPPATNTGSLSSSSTDHLSSSLSSPPLSSSLSSPPSSFSSSSSEHHEGAKPLSFHSKRSDADTSYSASSSFSASSSSPPAFSSSSSHSSASPPASSSSSGPEEVGFMIFDPTNFQKMSLSEKIRHFEVEGYVVFPGILNNDTIARLKKELEGAEMAPTSYSDAQTRSVIQPQWLSEGVCELVGYPPIMDFLSHLLGPDIVFTRGFYQKTLQGSPGISLHTDGQPHGSNLFGFEGSSPRLLRVLYYLDELTPERGPFRLVPRSHLSFHADASPYTRYKSHPEEITLLLPAGSAVIVPSMLFHGSHAQKDPQPRELVQLGFRPAWAGPIQLVDEWEPHLLATVPPISRPFFQSPNKSGFQWDQPHKPAGMRSDSEGIRPSRWIKEKRKEDYSSYSIGDSEKRNFRGRKAHDDL